MPSVKIQAIKGTSAVHRLREQKLKNGLAFMINVKGLDKNFCYREYPSGIIELVQVVHANRELRPVKKLSDTEADALRGHLQLGQVK